MSQRRSTPPGSPPNKLCRSCGETKVNDATNFVIVQTSDGPGTANKCRVCQGRHRLAKHLEKLAKDRAYVAAKRAGKV